MFFILANTIVGSDTAVNVDFFVDGEEVNNYIHNPTASSDFEYNVPVYVNESLPSGSHHLKMEATGSSSVLILFDYLIYT